jgi:hypothetical protein
MDILVGFLIRILKSTPVSGEGTEKMSIIIRRSYAHLETELKRIFNGQADVKVKVDRRYEERRTKKEFYPSERRRDDRRKFKEELVEVIISN